jgi:hypothetical protein
VNVPDVDLARMSAPAATRTWMAAALFSAAAHMSAVCPRQPSRAFTLAP